MGGIKTILKKIKEYQEQSDARFDARIQKAKTKADREWARAEVAKDRAKIKKELAEAKTAVLQAETARRKAKKELSEAGGTRLSNLLGSLYYADFGSQRRRKHKKSKLNLKKRARQTKKKAQSLYQTFTGF